MGTLAYLARRIVNGALVLLVVATFVFFLIRLSGNPVDLMLPQDATAADAVVLRHQLGLDQPGYIQYLHFIGSALRGDLGDSLYYQQPALGLVLERLPATLELVGIALVFTILIALPSGIVSAIRPGSWPDQVSRTLAVLGQSVPVFWLGILLILVFAVQLRLLPAFGSGGLIHALLPGAALATYTTPITARILRSSLIEVLHSDYVRTAKSKGLSHMVILLKHGLRNASLPVVTIFALRLAALLGGSVVTEQVFGYAGMGRLVLQAISQRDYPVVQAFVLVVAALVVSINLLVDFLYAILDPRIQVASA